MTNVYVNLENGVCPKAPAGGSCDILSPFNFALDKSVGKTSRILSVKTSYNENKDNDNCICTETFRTYAKATESAKIATKLTGADKIDLPQKCPHYIPSIQENENSEEFEEGDTNAWL